MKKNWHFYIILVYLMQAEIEITSETEITFWLITKMIGCAIIMLVALLYWYSEEIRNKKPKK